jgi:PKD repeat protein
MKNFLKSASVLILTLFVIMSCSKKSTPVPTPVACFEVPTGLTIMVGQTLTTTNCSANASSYSWDDGLGNISSGNTLSTSYAYTGTYSVELTASGNGESNSSFQTITVVPATGIVTFWLGATHNQTTVTINNTEAIITEIITSGTPTCDQSGCATFILPSGTYSFTATDGTSNWSGSVTVPINQCVKKELI